MAKTVYYAIGDIHGEAVRLSKMHDSIHEMHAKQFHAFNKTIVHLGDYVDRGPDSYSVIEIILALEARCDTQVISLKGNHEQLMLDAYAKNDPRAWKTWLENGGGDTLSSYRQYGFATPLEHHLTWLDGLKTMHWDKSANIIFVHAGVDPKRFPFDGDQVKLWTRARTFFNTESWNNPALDRMRIIHGHTPTSSHHPDISVDGKRINIDTGACYGGPLTAAVIAPNREPVFISV